jgi:methionine-rich copper-binding protein CopC
MVTATKTTMRRRGVRAARGGLAAAVLGLVLVSGAGPVDAHAKLTGSEPANGATVDQPPDAVTLTVDAKPATIEGDPLRVYGPDGQRLDDGRTSVSDDGHRVTVGLVRSTVRPAGHYEIAYRIVSADTHLIAGRLEFTAREAASPLATMTAAAGSGAGGLHSRLLHGWPDDARPLLAAAVAVTLVLSRLAWRLRPGRRARARRRKPREARRTSARTGGRPSYRPMPTGGANRSPGSRNGYARTR